MRAASPSSNMHPAFARGLSQGRTLFVISSDEDLLVQEAADALRAAARERGYSERHLFVVSGAHFKWDEVLATGNAMSLFADKQLLEVRIPSGKPGKDGGQALEQLAATASNNADLLTLITLPKLDKTGKNSSWYGALQSAGVCIDIADIERRQLPQWIAQRLQAHGQSVETGVAGEQALQWMADRVEGNLLAAYQEIQKLALLYPAGTLSYEQISSSVASVARYDVFKLSEAVLTGQTARVARMLQGLRDEGESHVVVHWALSEDARALHRLRLAMDSGQPLPVAISQARIWGPRQKLMERAAPRMNSQQTADLLHAAHIADGIGKGMRMPGWLADGWAALDRLAMMMCRLAA